jgi:hypothetical protein
MTQITRRPVFCPDLNQTELKVVQATNFPRVKEQQKQKLSQLVSSIINSCVIILGHSKKFEDEERFLIEREIVNDIFANFSGLTFEEIRLACSLGARGEYKSKPDEVVYFSVKSVYEWLKAYIATSKRAAMQKQARFEQDRFKKPEPTPEELKKLEDDFISECILKPYKIYQKTGEYLFDNRGNVIYNKLDKLGVIPFTVERKKEIFERAKNRVLIQLEQWLGPDTRRKYQQIQEGKGEGHELVKSEAKDLALRDFLREMKEVGMDLEEFIELRREG